MGMEWDDLDEEDQTAFEAAMGTPEDAKEAWKTVAKVRGKLRVKKLGLKA